MGDLCKQIVHNIDLVSGSDKTNKAPKLSSENLLNCIEDI